MVSKIHSLEDYIDMLKEKGCFLNTNADNDTLDRKVRYVSFNSMDVKYSTFFICKGIHFSESYLKKAAEEGAFAYLSEKKYDDVDIPYIMVNDVRKAMVHIADYYYNQVWKKLILTGITGTKGKSTTTYFMRYILDDYLKEQGKPKSAVLSGINNYDGMIAEESHLTTPEALELHRHFDNAVTMGIEYLTMEVSSQALKYDRTSGVIFDVGAFLNIGTDHISDIEHPDFEDYINSKLKIFEQCRTACINNDSQYASMALTAATKSKVTDRIITFGKTKDADIYGYDININNRDISFMVKSDSFDEEFQITMHGIFNVDNALAAIAISYALNIPVENIREGLRKAQVSGRMEIYTNPKKNINVIVDYAHNQMSFESLFKSTQKEFPGKKISIVFGCPGKKAFGRRKELGDLAGKYSDSVFITEEDAGEEPVQKICEEIASHVQVHDCKCSIIVDREQAIRAAIDEADENTIVLITGKGRETRQKRGNQYVNTVSDVEYVKSFLGDK